MPASHIELLVEEPSAEAALAAILPRILGDRASFYIHVFQGKPDLLKKLPLRLKGYRHWLPKDWRIVVLVDEDRQDCLVLKKRMEDACSDAVLPTKTIPTTDGRYFVVNRIAIEELESWYFGDVQALREAYPRVPATLGQKAKYRDPDAIAGGTWETLERLLQKHGYHRGGLAKTQAARDIAPYMDPDRNRSRSFCHLREALRELVGS